MKNKQDVYSCTSFTIYHKIEISKGKIFQGMTDETKLDHISFSKQLMALCCLINFKQTKNVMLLLLNKRRKFPCIKRFLLDYPAQWENYIPNSFQIEWDMMVVTVFLSILNQIEFHLNQNRKENCHYDHIPYNLKGNGNIVFSVYQLRCLI